MDKEIKPISFTAEEHALLVEVCAYLRQYSRSSNYAWILFDRLASFANIDTDIFILEDRRQRRKEHQAQILLWSKA